MNKKTKIIATISDRRCDINFLKELWKNGADAFRLNTAHQTTADTLRVVKNIRQVSEKIPIIIDTKGPEIRVSPDQKEMTMKKGQTVFIGHNLDKEKEISVSYKNIVNEIPIGKIILIDDGDISLKVKSKNGNKLLCVIENDGMIKPKKSVNIPEVKINLPSLSEKDKEYIQFCAEQKIDFIAHSFVRNKKDLDEIKKSLSKYSFIPEIISKIENQEGVDNIEEIIENCYGIMVARGDLGIEIPMEKIPSIQRKIIEKALERKRPVIVATQMLHTMIKNPRPTRSEVTDVANAVLIGADCLMLSGETASGDYPIEAVKTMSKIIVEVEKEKDSFDERPVKFINNEVAAFLAKSAVKATLSLPIKAIIADTLTGRTARYLSSFRSNQSIYVQCYKKEVIRKLAISYGIVPNFAKKHTHVGSFVKETLHFLLKDSELKRNDLVVVLAGSFGPNAGASFIEISTIENLLKSN